MATQNLTPSRQSRLVKFTKAFVARVVQGKEDPGPWTDTDSPLRLKGTQGGASYSVKKKVDGKARVFTPRDQSGQPLENSAGILTLEQARAWATGLVVNITLGKPAQAEKSARIAFGELAKDYLEQYAKTHAETSTRAETWGARYASDVLKDMHVADIGAAAAQQLKDAHTGSPANLRKAWGVAKRVMDLAVSRNLAQSNIFAAMPAPKAPRAKTGFPQLHELPAIWQACEATQGVGAAIIRFSLVMPLRPDTVASLAWGEVDLDRRELRLAPGDGRKFKSEQRLPLPSLACELLSARRPSDPDPKALVFGSDSPKNPGGKFSGWDNAVARIRKRSGVGGWSCHDFRRSAVSIVAEQRPDVSESSLDRWLTHAASSTNTGVKAVYQRAAGFRGMRIVADAWDEILRGALAGNVVPMRRAG